MTLGTSNRRAAARLLALLVLVATLVSTSLAVAKGRAQVEDEGGTDDDVVEVVDDGDASTGPARCSWAISSTGAGASIRCLSRSGPGTRPCRP